MKILIAYDVSQRHPEVKTALQGVGFLDRWKKGETIYYLPNTTLWHSNLSNPKKAKEIFLELIEILNNGQPPKNIIRSERFIAVDWNTSSGIPGDPHA